MILNFLERVKDVERGTFDVERIVDGIVDVQDSKFETRFIIEHSNGKSEVLTFSKENENNPYHSMWLLNDNFKTLKQIKDFIVDYQKNPVGLHFNKDGVEIPENKML